MPYVMNEGAALYWEEHGAGDPVLMIMGLSFTLEMWFRVLPAVTPDYRVILFDNRGMGRSSVPRGPYSIRQMARDAVAVLNAAGVEQAHVIGASMGGMIAQELALNYPGRVRSLVLGCTTHGGFLSRWPDFSKRPRGVKWSTAERLERERAVMPMLYADTTPIERIEEDIHLRYRCQWNSRGFYNQLAAILLWTSYRRLPRITAPTLVVHGDQDRLVPMVNGRVVAKRIRGAQFKVIQNAGHILTTDQPEACAQKIQEFLRSQA
jgi:pimeloyl-ACP methyl ester carboxylesterase